MCARLNVVLLLILCLFASVAPAQAPLPESTRAWLATNARLEGMTLDDFTRLISQAQAGDAESQYLVARAYREGRLVPLDDAAFASWMRKSAEQDYGPAQASMGDLYIAGVRDVVGPIPHCDEAEKWLRLAAKQGNADAQFWLGAGYQRGWFGKSDDREAFEWITKAAAQGLPNAQFRLGQMYEDGEEVQQSDTTAASWYRKAADHFPQWVGGVSEAVAQLANMYRDGRLKDDVQAYMWFAVIGSSWNPSSDDDVKGIARHMTQAQIAEAQGMAKDWIKRHR